MRSKCSALRGMDDKQKARKEENNSVCIRLFLVTFLIGTVLIIMTLILPVPVFMLFHSISSMVSLKSILLAVLFILFPLVGFLRINNILLYSPGKFCQWNIVYSYNGRDHKERNNRNYNYLTFLANNNLAKINLIALCLYRYGQNIEGFKGFCYSFCCQFAQDLLNSFHDVDEFILLLDKGVDISLNHHNGRYVGGTRNIINRLNDARVATDENIVSCSSIEGDGCNEREDESCEGMQCDVNHYSYAGLIQLPCNYNMMNQLSDENLFCSSNNDYEIYACEGIANTLQVNG